MLSSHMARGEDGARERDSRRLYIETYGCQMNFSDSEIVASILGKHGYTLTEKPADADLILLNSCSIRDKAEQTIRKRLASLTRLKKDRPHLLIGLLGCMAERLKAKLIEQEKIISLVVGPDAYRDLPRLVGEVEVGIPGVNTLLSREETYADISPVRLGSNRVTAFVSIMRGCDNMCSFCVVPFTRGRERSRDPESIVRECREIFEQGYREVTLLGQNVDSYRYHRAVTSSPGTRGSGVISFEGLLERVANVDPDLRIRFATSHPKDLTNGVLEVIGRHSNICKQIHLPVQSGNSRILRLMNRTYDREWYLERIEAIRSILGETCGITTDIIAGFCSETEQEHGDTLSLMEQVRFDYSYMFCYSERPKTLASRKYPDDVDISVKKRRLTEIIDLQNRISLARNRMDLNETFEVLVEGKSKRSELESFGRNSAGKVVILKGATAPEGTYQKAFVTDCTGATLMGKLL